ncbi:Hypothetical protein PFR_JS21-2_1128 [Propionibacterium freudenreichii]|nr:Hypothetical protein PFR_JS4_805 [Propionibacterium freudenreichii]SCQ56121.1 Hypothetical protein PFR_JS21-1_1129 [Propionibacterium freudenreichii]SCQ58365.1 Hypothetical protein PFR_JS25-1_984 [Propionibacterium freudenreichii]SCQ62017.1 Hypothetical protein PFR_JS21-2_1128 [Propionibacterium freudenreichii]
MVFGMTTTIADLEAPPPEWTVVVQRLPSGTGRCLWSARQIILDDRLTAPQARCTLAHEILHARRGAVPQWQHEREESLIGQTVARTLISLESLVHALQWSTDILEVADELGVDDHTLAVRLEHLHPSEQAALNTRLADVTR